MKHILIDFENTQPDAAQLRALNPDDSHIWLFLGKNQQKTLPIELCEALCRFGRHVHFIRIAKTGKNALDFYLAYYLGQITTEDNDALICILSRDTGFDVLVEHLENEHLCRGIIRLAALEDAAELPGTAQLTAEKAPPVASVTPPTAEKASPAASATPPTAEEAPPAASVALHSAEVITAAEQPPAAALQDDAARILDICKKAQAHLMHADYRPRQRKNLETRLANHLRDTLSAYDTETARTLISQAVDKLIRKTLISIGTDGLLTYHLSERELQQRLIARIQAAKTKTVDALKNTIRVYAGSLYLGHSDSDIEACIRYCEQHNILRCTDNHKIQYPPYPADNGQLQQQASYFLSKFKQNKPAKRSSLISTIQQMLKTDTAQTDALIHHLVAQKKLRINDNGALTWL